jgi:hypothetical protein
MIDTSNNPIKRQRLRNLSNEMRTLSLAYRNGEIPMEEFLSKISSILDEPQFGRYSQFSKKPQEGQEHKEGQERINLQRLINFHNSKRNILSFFEERDPMVADILMQNLSFFNSDPEIKKALIDLVVEKEYPRSLLVEKHPNLINDILAGLSRDERFSIVKPIAQKTTDPAVISALYQYTKYHSTVSIFDEVFTSNDEFEIMTLLAKNTKTPDAILRELLNYGFEPNYKHAPIKKIIASNPGAKNILRKIYEDYNLNFENDSKTAYDIIGRIAGNGAAEPALLEEIYKYITTNSDIYKNMNADPFIHDYFEEDTIKCIIDVISKNGNDINKAKDEIRSAGLEDGSLHDALDYVDTQSRHYESGKRRIISAIGSNPNTPDDVVKAILDSGDLTDKMKESMLKLRESNTPESQSQVSFRRMLEEQRNEESKAPSLS